MMVSGELDATLLYFVDRNLIDRSTVDLWNHSAIEPLFRDPVAEGARYYKKTGLFPINHGMALKRSIVDRHPWVVLNLYKAFVRANELTDAQRLEHAEYHFAAGLLSPEAYESLRMGLVEHGIKANRAVLETIAR
jgi:4,5-dihydroxyphthalate decarboxylase